MNTSPILFLDFPVTDSKISLKKPACVSPKSLMFMKMTFLSWFLMVVMGLMKYFLSMFRTST